MAKGSPGRQRRNSQGTICAPAKASPRLHDVRQTVPQGLNRRVCSRRELRRPASLASVRGTKGGLDTVAQTFRSGTRNERAPSDLGDPVDRRRPRRTAGLHPSSRLLPRNIFQRAYRCRNRGRHRENALVRNCANRHRGADDDRTSEVDASSSRPSTHDLPLVWDHRITAVAMMPMARETTARPLLSDWPTDGTTASRTTTRSGFVVTRTAPPSRPPDPTGRGAVGPTERTTTDSISRCRVSRRRPVRAEGPWCSSRHRIIAHGPGSVTPHTEIIA